MLETQINTQKAKTEPEMAVGVDKPLNNVIYGASILSILLSLFLVPRSRNWATFTGLWAPTILGLGIFMKENKLIELQKRQAGII